MNQKPSAGAQASALSVPPAHFVVDVSKEKILGLLTRVANPHLEQMLRHFLDDQALLDAYRGVKFVLQDKPIKPGTQGVVSTAIVEAIAAAQQAANRVTGDEDKDIAYVASFLYPCGIFLMELPALRIGDERSAGRSLEELRRIRQSLALSEPLIWLRHADQALARKLAYLGTSHAADTCDVMVDVENGVIHHHFCYLFDWTPAQRGRIGINPLEYPVVARMCPRRCVARVHMTEPHAVLVGLHK